MNGRTLGAAAGLAGGLAMIEESLGILRAGRMLMAAGPWGWGLAVAAVGIYYWRRRG